MRNSLNVGALTAGALLASGAAAQASPTMTSTDHVGALNGTQAVLPVQAPVNLCGNAAAVGGAGFAACDGGAVAALDPAWSFDNYRAYAHKAYPQPRQAGPSLVSTGHTGIGNGTQVYAPIQVPIDVCGNAVAVLGTATGGCTGGASADLGTGPAPHADRAGDDSGYRYERPDKGKAEVVAVDRSGPVLTSTGNVGLLNGTQALIPVQIPINICGNALAVLGAAQAGCEGGATATNRL